MPSIFCIETHCGFRAFQAAVLALGIICCPWAAKNSLCGETPRLERSRSSPPAWLTRVPESDGRYLYFVGRAGGESSLEAAETDAAADAVRQIVSLVGLQAAFSYERVRHEAGLLLEDRLALAGNSPVVGLKRIESYFEKRTFQASDSLRVYYDSHLLIRLPVESVENARTKLEQEATERVSQAESLLARGRDLERGAELHAAFDCYRSGLDGLRAAPAAFGNEPAARRDIQQQLFESVFRTGLRLRFVEIAPPDSGMAGEALREVLSSSLLDQGFTPVQSDSPGGLAGLPCLRVTCVQSDQLKIEEGFRLSLWSVTFKLTNPLSGEVILSYDYTVKGFGPDSERAALDARRKMRLEVIPRFAVEACERLDRVLGPASAAPDDKHIYTK